MESVYYFREKVAGIGGLFGRKESKIQSLPDIIKEKPESASSIADK